MVSLGDERWRMLRRVELYPLAEPVPWSEVRNYGKHEDEQIGVLLSLGLLERLGSECFGLTAAGREAARFGQVDAAALTAATKAVRDAVEDNRRKVKRAIGRLRQKGA